MYIDIIIRPYTRRKTRSNKVGVAEMVQSYSSTAMPVPYAKIFNLSHAAVY